MGGTQFVGRAMTETLLAAGHQITHFNRGKTGAGLFPQVETIIGDRNADLSALDQPWDVVIDVNAYTPDQTRALNHALKKFTGHFVFISTISVYQNAVGRLPEEAPRQQLEHDPGEVTAESYGPYKAICEDLVLERFGDRATILRPGLIVGPHDPTGRFTYWPIRYAEGGEILVPDADECAITALDVRDLAEFTRVVVETPLFGIYNCDRPTATFGDLRRALNELAREEGVEFSETQVPLDFLQEQDIWPWRELPGLVPDGLSIGDSARAIAAGLPETPLIQTLRDTLVWAKSERLKRPLKAGLSVEQECKALQAWNSR